MLIQNTLKSKLPSNFAKSNNLILAFLLLVGAYWLQTDNRLFADMNLEYKRQLEAQDASRDRAVDGFFDMQYNKVSNIQFTVHSDGRMFYDTKLRRLTGIWPRGSVNGYVFGGGIWVGTKKRNYVQVWDDVLQDSVPKIITDTMRHYSYWDWENPITDPVTGNITGLRELRDSMRVVEYEIDTNRAGYLVDVTYDPRSAQSYMAPGRMEEGDAAITTDTRSYRVYFSMDYDPGTGEPLLEESGPAWPIWDDLPGEENVVKYDRYFGHYIRNQNNRNLSVYPKGPAFISGEDIFVTYKDTDLARANYLGAVGYLTNQGYPIRLQYEQMIYSWGFGDYRDFIFIKYDQINNNTDTLWDMWLAPIFDIDIGLITDGGNGAVNDKTSFYGMEHSTDGKPDSLRAMHNMAYQYSESTRGEGGKGFGYVGFVFLESPAVIGETIDFNRYAQDQNPVIRRLSDSLNFVRKDGTWLRTDPRTALLDTCKQLPDGSWVCGDINSDNWFIETNVNYMKRVPWYPVKEQLGLRSFRNWANGKDPNTIAEMYQWISYNGNGGWDGPQASADMRYMMATGPFHMRPGDTSRTVVGLLIAAPGKGGDATGDTVDLAELVRKTEFMQKVYDENFRAPQPPDPAVITTVKPLNNGMLIQWDSTSELSSDFYERGLAFMGYRIYRARRSNLDTFNLNDIAGNSIYPAGQGPFGWKELRSYTMPTPYIKSTTTPPVTEGSGPTAQTFFGTDSLFALGPYYIRDPQTGKMVIDPASILAVRVPSGVALYPPGALWAAIEREKAGNPNRLPMLEASGWYADSIYGGRIVPVVSYIDSSMSVWSKFYYEHNDFDLNQSALFGAPDSIIHSRPSAPKSFLWDSVMLCRLELNVALARINPLFYKQMRVRVPQVTVDSFLVKYDSAGVLDEVNGSPRKGDAHWITRDSLDADGRPVIEPTTGLKITVNVNIDTLYDISSLQRMEDIGESFWTINCMTLRDTAGKDWLRDTTHYKLVRDSIYRYIELGWIKNVHSADFGGDNIYTVPFSSSDIAKNEVIIPYMKELTNNRTFVDIGDDPEPGKPFGNAYISEVDDPTRTERLLNNVEYYYKVVSFDEGDWLQPTPTKNNVGLEGLPNWVETYPSADRPAAPVRFSVIGTEGVLGGLFNPQLFALNEERVAQLFAGDTLLLELSPVAYGSAAMVTHKFGPTNDSAVRDVPAGVYYMNVKLTNLTKDMELLNETAGMEVTACSPTQATTWVDNAMYRVGADTVTQEGGAFGYSDMGVQNSRQSYAPINVSFTTGDFKTPDFCYSMNQSNMLRGNLGLSFNLGLKQHGGVYRADSADISGLDHEVSTIVHPLSGSDIDWSNTDWYINEAYKTGATLSNRLPLLGDYYGMKTMEDVGSKEVMPTDWVTWLQSLDPPKNPFSGEFSLLDNVVSQQYNARFDNGPGVYEVTFKAGGLDTLNLTWQAGGGVTVPFEVRYLTIDINDSYSFNRYAPDLPGVDSVSISYPSVIEPMVLPTFTGQSYDPATGGSWTCLTPHPKNLGFYQPTQDPNIFYRKYNLFASAYANCGSTGGAPRGDGDLKEGFARDIELLSPEGMNILQYVGQQNRYYLSAKNLQTGDSVEFVHTLNIAGAQWSLAYNRWGYRPNGSNNDAEMYVLDMDGGYHETYKDDFKAGDKIKLISWGGVSGFPERGAKVKFAVSNPYVDYTDDVMEQVTVVPNPYVITHQTQASPYGAEVYFTKLPPVCEIEIFTAAGDLVTSVSHDETIEGTRKGIAIYDLLTKNGQRVQSQTLVALIKAPNGSMTTKHFSVIVGGFRVVE